MTASGVSALAVLGLGTAGLGVAIVRLLVSVARGRRVPSNVRVKEVRAALRAGTGPRVALSPEAFVSLSVEMIVDVAAAEGYRLVDDVSVAVPRDRATFLVFGRPSGKQP